MTNMADPPPTPTMATIAELAGVSKITVSRALRGSDLVRPEVRERIAEVARATGYRMNVAARSLRTRKTRTVAVVIEKLNDGERPISDPVLLLLLGGLLEVLTPADYAMLVTTSDHFLASMAVAADGIIMMGQGEGARRMAEVQECGLPMVVWGASEGKDASIIGSDNRLGGRLAAEHLVGLGRQKLLFLGDPAHPEVARRLDGVRDVLTSCAAMLADVRPAEFSRQAGARAVAAALDSGVDFDGVIAVSDYIAAGACDTLIERGIPIPEAVAVIGFDDIAVAANHRPPLSSIRQEWGAGGRVLAGALLAKLGEREEEIASLLPVTLVARASTVG